MGRVAVAEEGAVHSLFTMRQTGGTARPSEFGASSFLREAPAGSSIADALQGHPHQQDLAA